MTEDKSNSGDTPSRRPFDVDESDKLFTQAVTLHQQGKMVEAVRAYAQILSKEPRHPDIYNNLGVALRTLGKLEAAVACYRRALAYGQEAANVYSNLGNALRELARFEEAEAAHGRSVKLDAASPSGIYNGALVDRDLCRDDVAMKKYDQALEIDPDYVDCHGDRSLLLLRNGNLEEGFPEYEWRWRLSNNPPRGFKQPLWDGSDLTGKTILLHQEQGFGDMIQFARYVPLVKEKGGTVLIECQPELLRLFETLEGVDLVVSSDAPLPDFDVAAPIITLAKIFGTTLESIPNTVPYVRAPEQQNFVLSPHSGTVSVGICWAGKPTHKNDRNRSCSFVDFMDLTAVPDTTFFSLQKGDAISEYNERAGGILIADVGSKMNDFADTAMVLEQLDVLITVDTSIAHLAGAMGRPVWVLVPFAPDWRWLLDRNDSPWYPSMRLFRQTETGNWAPVFKQVEEELRKLTEEKS